MTKLLTLVWNSIKIRPLRAALFHADGQTDRQVDVMRLIVAFRNFANSPNKNEHYLTGRDDTAVCALIISTLTISNFHVDDTFRSFTSTVAYEPQYLCWLFLMKFVFHSYKTLPVQGYCFVGRP